MPDEIVLSDDDEQALASSWARRIKEEAEKKRQVRKAQEKGDRTKDRPVQE